MVRESLYVISRYIEVNELHNLLEKSLPITNLHQIELEVGVFINAERYIPWKIKDFGSFYL